MIVRTRNGERLNDCENKKWRKKRLRETKRETGKREMKRENLSKGKERERSLGEEGATEVKRKKINSSIHSLPPLTKLIQIYCQRWYLSYHYYRY